MRRKKLKGWGKSSANIVNLDDLLPQYTVSSKQVYSTELRNLTYFEVYSRGIVVRDRVYFSYPGLSLSSFRYVQVLCTKSLDIMLRNRRGPKKFVVLKSTSNQTLILTERDVSRIAMIYDVRRLKELTGKDGTIPMRLLMRLKTLKRAKWVPPNFIENRLLQIFPRYYFHFHFVSLILYQIPGSLGMILHEHKTSKDFEFLSTLSDRFLVLRYSNGFTIIPYYNVEKPITFKMTRELVEIARETIELLPIPENLKIRSNREILQGLKGLQEDLPRSVKGSEMKEF